MFSGLGLLFLVLNVSVCLFSFRPVPLKRWEHVVVVLYGLWRHKRLSGSNIKKRTVQCLKFLCRTYGVSMFLTMLLSSCRSFISEDLLQSRLVGERAWLTQTTQYIFVWHRSCMWNRCIVGLRDMYIVCGTDVKIILIFLLCPRDTKHLE